MSTTGWYDRLVVGHEEVTPDLLVDGELLHRAVTIAGYRHPLFVDPGYAAASPLGATPLPGGVLLGFLGGLVEHCPMFEDAPAVLAGFDEVRFRRPVVAGDVVTAVVRVEGKWTTGGGTRLVEFAWEVHDRQGEVVATVRATFAVVGVPAA